MGEGRGGLCPRRKGTEYDDYSEVVGEQTKITDLELSRHNMCHGRVIRERDSNQSKVSVSFVRGLVRISLVVDNTSDTL